MFAIYNNGRVGFRSTSDNLYNLKNVEEIHETHLKPEEGFVEYFTKYNANKKKTQKENAISAYKKWQILILQKRFSCQRYYDKRLYLY